MPDLFTQPALELGHRAAQRSADKADRLTNNEWSEKADEFLYIFAKHHDTFQCSQVREAASGIVPEHPSMDPRCWGAVLQRASKRGMIVAMGYGPTNNRTSHGRPERIWTLK